MRFGLPASGRLAHPSSSALFEELSCSSGGVIAPGAFLGTRHIRAHIVKLQLSKSRSLPVVDSHHIAFEDLFESLQLHLTHRVQDIGAHHLDHFTFREFHKHPVRVYVLTDLPPLPVTQVLILFLRARVEPDTTPF